jgi:hypothetical protein
MKMYFEIIWKAMLYVYSSIIIISINNLDIMVK